MSVCIIIKIILYNIYLCNYDLNACKLFLFANIIYTTRIIDLHRILLLYTFYNILPSIR